MRNDFESAIDPAWQIKNPERARLDTTAPISGAQSLVFDGEAVVALDVPPACAVTLRFKLRADAVAVKKAAMTLAKISAGKRWYYLTISAGSLMMNEEIHTSQVVSLGSGMPLATLEADKTVDIVFGLDTQARMARVAIDGNESARPARVIETEGSPPSLQSITKIELGAATGIQNTVSGKYWIDDLTIE